MQGNGKLKKFVKQMTKTSINMLLVHKFKHLKNCTPGHFLSLCYDASLGTIRARANTIQASVHSKKKRC